MSICLSVSLHLSLLISNPCYLFDAYSKVYASVTTANPSPLNYDFADTTSNVTKIVYITRNVVDTQSKVYVAVQGSAITNTYKIVWN